MELNQRLHIKNKYLDYLLFGDWPELKGLFENISSWVGAIPITGDISEKNISLANGKIVLSPEGAELLIKEIQQQLVK
ncbi:AbrB family transcriptional regulator [Bacillus cereus]|uniref:AbrB family transcriptional regulator n=1 Tax=Bacillus cereus TaxID=1396 RepID=UPI002AC0C271|nr:AbrB family transcriptional regulator [Bacillus cereus]MDZ4411997.1 AbrB family transcriptional regulator [Bacillus cereus]MDZ4531834.1 AbrB family transcriptional regulator [Bacillus cereus]